jgi:PST family polysaccharide transporter
MLIARFKQNIIVKNAFYLSVIQVFNYVFPMLTLPYLVKVLGAERFGIIAFSQVVVSQLAVFCDYGFNMSATREISLNKQNVTEVSRIFSAVIYLKILIGILTIIIMSVVIMTMPMFGEFKAVYFISLLYLIGQILFPTWLFQGLEQMRLITLINSIFKIAGAIATFIFVRSRLDINIAAWIYGVSSLLAGAVALVLAIWKYRLKFIKSEILYLKKLLVDGFDVFIPSFFANVLSSGGVLVLGVFYSAQVVGYYAAIDKLVKAGMALLSTVTQSMFPNVSYQFSQDKKQAINSIIKIGKPVVGILLVVLMIMLFASGPFLRFIYSPEYANYAYVLNVLLVWATIGFVNNFLGIQFLIGSGNSRYYRKSFLYSGICMVISFIAIKYWAINGVLFSMLLGEVLLTFFMIVYIKKLRLYVV